MYVIRPFGLRDAWAIKHLQSRGVRFDLRRVLDAPSPTRSALLALWTRHHLGAPTLVYYGAKRSDVRGFVQLEVQRGGQTWDLAYLAPSLEEQEDAPYIWQELITQAILMAAEHQVLRVYARPPQDSEIEQLLRRAGFALVTREEIYVLSEPPTPLAQPRGLRQADREDSWALGELYRKAMPPLVYQAQETIRLEGLGRVPLLNNKHMDYVWTERGEIVAHLSLVSHPRGYWIECAVLPSYRSELLPHISYLLSLTDCSPVQPVYFAVPSYDVGLGWLLRTLGFGSFGEQLVMVAHTAKRVRVSRPVVGTAFESTVDVATPLGTHQALCEDSALDARCHIGYAMHIRRNGLEVKQVK